MNLDQTKLEYLEKGEFFFPDYDRENEVLSAFKASNESLSATDVFTLVDILNTKTDWKEKFFVADLLYLYPDFPEALVEPMLNCAVIYQDPSFDRIFLRPCMKRIGVQAVVKKLIHYLNNGSLKERMGVTWLSYWVRGDETSRSMLETAMMNQAEKTTNPVELYHYKLRLNKTLPLFDGIPNDAQGLMAIVKQILSGKEHCSINSAGNDEIDSSDKGCLFGRAPSQKPRGRAFRCKSSRGLPRCGLSAAIAHAKCGAPDDTWDHLFAFTFSTIHTCREL